MNHYGLMAQEHWQQYLPHRYAQIPQADRERFFTSLGNQAWARVEELTDQAAGDDRPGETFLDKLGRLKMSRLSAEELVKEEMLLPDPATDLPANSPPAPAAG